MRLFLIARYKNLFDKTRIYFNFLTFSTSISNDMILYLHNKYNP